ncbi:MULTISPECIES: 3-hydroxyacyl-CoA dehydrogenase family protein [unclassified Rathayibacter]|uniref:3-hydroxyacyl-CoA dehydrogenase family protein n=1 Tax=unclassified Rathayibacter TaxID=2609250 RepID=UPI0006FA1780|nr:MULTISPECIES: 3-hydroxyacyl-CoA dehydrogenase family protein [unclassified Rathayibacter]KQQ01283.1 3-hydroxybutyryl-CoA dehydrogenase [Rathayibacter sp. Leaf294]KQS11314.1 3-hydroxybutyryl-CoA dehydrogenase [Rathayibacter sp. Leaf185]
MSVPSRVGVVGGGTMGAGIAQVFAQAGASVVILERDVASIAAATERLDAGIARSASRFEGYDADAVRARLAVEADYGVLAGADLVVEAVPEIIGLKRETLQRVERAVSPEAWIATNTSSLPVSDLALALERPERCFGLHFFNPVPASALIEVVVAPTTHDGVPAMTRTWAEALGKTAIVVRDAPGFASSRLGLALALEAMRMVEQGVASADDVDAAMVLGYRHATGPLRTTDLVGLDVRLGIAEHLASTLGERFEPPAILRRLVDEGWLGRKSGRGFFDYPGSLR